MVLGSDLGRRRQRPIDDDGAKQRADQGERLAMRHLLLRLRHRPHRPGKARGLQIV